MALRLRRGTESERQNLVTPLAEGELIYVTDTGKLFIGDGSATGGIEVVGSGGGGGGSTTLNGLTDTDLAGYTDGDVLTFVGASNKWEPIPIPGASPIGMNDLTDVNYTNVNALDILIFDGFNFITTPVTSIFQEQMNYRINIYGDDSTLLVDTDTNSFRGLLFGDVQGDVKGSVFGDDSTLLVDGVNSVITGPVDNLSSKTTNSVVTGLLKIESADTQGATGGLSIKTEQNADDNYDLFTIYSASNSDVGSAINYIRSRGTLAAPVGNQADDELMGVNYFGYDSNNNSQAAVVLQASVGAAPSAGIVPGDFLIATSNPVSGVVAALSVDHLQKTSFFGPAKLMSYADTTARDAAIASPEAGMMIYLTATNKAQVYDGSAWTDLH